MPNELLLPGRFPGLLVECSPARGEHGECVVLLVDDGRAEVAWKHPCSPVRRSVELLGNLELRLESITGAAHAVHWLLGTTGVHEPRLSFFFDYRYVISFRKRHERHRYARLTLGHLTGWADRENADGCQVVPSLAGLYPEDLRELANGQCRVPVMALQRVCLFVGEDSSG